MCSNLRLSVTFDQIEIFDRIEIFDQIQRFDHGSTLCPPPRLAAQRQLERALRAPARGVNLDAVAHCGAAMAWRCDADDLTDEGDERLVPRCNAVARDCRVACSRVYAAASGGGIAATQPPPQCRAAVPTPPETAASGCLEVALLHWTRGIDA